MKYKIVVIYFEERFFEKHNRWHSIVYYLRSRAIKIFHPLQMKYYVEIINRIELSFDYHLLEIHGIFFASNSLYSGGIEDQCGGVRDCRICQNAERERQNGNRDEKRRKRSNLVSLSGNSTGEFYNEVRSDGKFTFFQPPICTWEAKWEHFKDGKPSGRSKVDVNEAAKLLLAMAGCHIAHILPLALSHDCRRSFCRFAFFFTGRKI